MTGVFRLPVALGLLFYQSVVLALGQIRTNKVRSLLTTIGIVIGVASVTAVIAALTGLRSKVLSTFDTIGTNKIFIFPSRPQTGPMRNANFKQIRFLPEDFDGLLEHCPSVSAFTRVIRSSAQGKPISYGPRSEEDVEVTGIEPDWHKIENRSVVMGRPFTLIDNAQARPVCLINDKVRDRLAMPIDCTSESLLIGGRRFLVVGVVETQTESSMFGGSGSGLEVFIPFSTSWAAKQANLTVMANSRSPELSEEARAELEFFVRHKRHITAGQPDTFRIEAVQKFLDQFNSVALVMTVVASGVVSISLLVGGVGIMNIMLVSVSERTREIGLRKAVGARPSAILLQFLVEAIMLCCFGGAIGLGGGQALTFLMRNVPQFNLEKAAIPGWAAALAFGFSAGVGLIFGMFPAIKASRLDPIEALRHE